MKIIENIFYNDNPNGYGDLFCPDKAVDCNYAILLIHGGGWNSMDKKDVIGIATFLCDSLQLPVYNINYTLSCEKPFPACINDCIDGANFLLENPYFQLKKLFIVGGSAGGHLALLTGLKMDSSQVAGIVSISGIADLESDYRLAPERHHELFGKNNISASDFCFAEPANYLQINSPPILCTHALNDNVVLYESAEIFVKKAKQLNLAIELFSYEVPEDGYSHRIWIPDSNPHKLYPFLEEKIKNFITKFKEF
jgi:acetyl esterase/lipase